MKNFVAGLLSFLFGVPIMGPGDFHDLNISGRDRTAELYVADLPSEKLSIFLLQGGKADSVRPIAGELAKMRISTIVLNLDHLPANTLVTRSIYSESISQAILAATHRLHLKKDPETVLIVDDFWKRKLNYLPGDLAKHQIVGLISEQKTPRGPAAEGPAAPAMATIENLPNDSRSWDQDVALLENQISALYNSYENHHQKSNLTYGVLPNDELIEFAPGLKKSDELVILFSGDGGWSDFSRDLAEEYSKRGFPVIGINLISYFWEDKSATQVARDIQMIHEHYLKQWGAKKLRLVGFSHGADILPFVFNALPKETATLVSGVSIISPSLSTSFKFTMVSWFSDLDEELHTLPETQRMLARLPMLTCVYGEEESEKSLCSHIDSPTLKKRLMPGGHHLDYDVELIVENSLS